MKPWSKDTGIGAEGNDLPHLRKKLLAGRQTGHKGQRGSEEEKLVRQLVEGDSATGARLPQARK